MQFHVFLNQKKTNNLDRSADQSRAEPEPSGGGNTRVTSDPALIRILYGVSVSKGEKEQVECWVLSLVWDWLKFKHTNLRCCCSQVYGRCAIRSLWLFGVNKHSKKHKRSHCLARVIRGKRALLVVNTPLNHLTLNVHGRLWKFDSLDATKYTA